MGKKKLKQNISTSGMLPSNFADQADDNSDRHEVSKQSDEQVADETSALGSASEEPLDIDEAVENMGMRSDNQGPKQLKDTEELAENAKDEWEK